MSSSDSKDERRRFHVEQHRKLSKENAELKRLLASTRMEVHELNERLRSIERWAADAKATMSKQTSQLEMQADTMRKLGDALRGVVLSITDDGK